VLCRDVTEEDFVSVHIRVVGDWTGKMEKLFNPDRNLGVGTLPVSIDRLSPAQLTWHVSYTLHVLPGRVVDWAL
jgi:hypothetical protein